MIKRLVVKGLHGKFDFDLAFNEDLNILTGKNGSGKTTILKLLWYLISGNLHRITSEMRFDIAEIETSKFSLKISWAHDTDVLSLEWRIGKGVKHLQKEKRKLLTLLIRVRHMLLFLKIMILYYMVVLFLFITFQLLAEKRSLESLHIKPSNLKLLF